MENTISKFAYLICDPLNDDAPLIGDDNIRKELRCTKQINIVLSKLEAKNNPTALAIKHLKFLKENYFYLTTKLNLYDVNNFVRDHYIFLYAFSIDASCGNLEEFNSEMKLKYGNLLFIPFTLNEESSSRLSLLTEFDTFVADLFGVPQVSSKMKATGEKFLSIVSGKQHDLLAEILSGKSLNSKDLEILMAYAIQERKSLLTNGW